MLRLLALIVTILILVTGCNGNSTTEEPLSNPTATPTLDPRELLQEAADKLRGVSTFRMLLEQTGADYPFSISVEDIPATAVLLRAEAQYVAPNIVFATVKLSLSGLPLNLDIYAEDGDQWWRMQPGPWLNSQFAPDFNPGSFIAEGSGFQRALSSLVELRYMGLENLIDGTPVFHLSGVADGATVRDLLVGLIETTNDVLVDVFVHRETHFPSLVVVTQPDTATTAQPEDTTWRVEVYDVNATVDIQSPKATP